MDTKKKETKDKEKKSKSGDKPVKDKKDKKEKTSSKDAEKVIKVMQKEFETWIDAGDETANIGTQILESGAVPERFLFGSAAERSRATLS